MKKKLLPILFLLILTLCFTSVASAAFTESSTGMELSIPDDWSKVKTSKGDQSLDLVLVSDKKENHVILYSAEDLFNSSLIELPGIVKFLLPRQILDNSLLDSVSNSQLKDIFKGITGSNVGSLGRKKFGQTEYFVLEMDTKIIIDGQEIVLPDVWLFRLDKGNFYSFQFYGDTNSDEYDDFKDMVKSAEYPEVAGNYNLLIILIALVVIIAAIIVLVSVKKAKARKKAKTDLEHRYCCECGATLELSFTYCPYCATKVIQEL